MNTEIIHHGVITLSGKVVVSDPCYDRGAWCMKTDFPVKPGRYYAFAVYSDEGKMGIRVAALALYHEDYIRMPLFDWQRIDCTIGVDSGQCGIFDDSAYPQTKDHPDHEPFYDECCKITLADSQAGILRSKQGVVSTSGYGDGTYALKTIAREGENVALMLDFDLVNMGAMVRKLTAAERGIEQ